MRVSMWSLTGVRSVKLKRIALVWLVSEILALVLVVKLLGLGGAMLLTAATSLLGIVVLRRVGLAAASGLRRGLGGAGATSEGAVLDSTATALGALLLILPGFATDLVGLALATPSVRQHLIARFGGRPTDPAAAMRPRRSGAPEVIDLSPDDWTVVREPPR